MNFMRKECEGIASSFHVGNYRFPYDWWTSVDDPAKNVQIFFLVVDNNILAAFGQSKGNKKFNSRIAPQGWRRDKKSKSTEIEAP